MLGRFGTEGFWAAHVCDTLRRSFLEGPEALDRLADPFFTFHHWRHSITVTIVARAPSGAKDVAFTRITPNFDLRDECCLCTAVA